MMVMAMPPVMVVVVIVVLSGAVPSTLPMAALSCPPRAAVGDAAAAHDA